MNTFKVRRSLAAFVVGAICAGAGVLGLVSHVMASDAVWLGSSAKGSAKTFAAPLPIRSHLGEKDAVWL